MMLFLAEDILLDLRQLPDTYAESPIAGLPGKKRFARKFFMDPLRGAGFDELDSLGNA